MKPTPQRSNFDPRQNSARLTELRGVLRSRRFSVSFMLRLRPLFSIVAALLAFTACKQLDLSAPSSSDRVLTGVVTAQNAGELPSGAEVTIQIVDLSRGPNQPEILGEQTIKAPAVWPVPFRIEFQADDALLLRGVGVDARVAVGGKLRYATRTAHAVTVANVGEQHLVNVELATQP